jgi:hypothetical protein
MTTAQNTSGPKWVKGFPNSAEEANRQGKTYFMGSRCLDCATVVKWAHNGYCMQCNAYKPVNPRDKK